MPESAPCAAYREDQRQTAGNKPGRPAPRVKIVRPVGYRRHHRKLEATIPELGDTPIPWYSRTASELGESTRAMNIP